MLVIFCQHRDALTAAERAMVAGLRDLPGLLLVNTLVTTGRRTREIDGIWVHPEGVTVIEAKGTRLAGKVTPSANGAWTVDEAPADFASGPNPLAQARTAAQALKSHWTADGHDVGFIPAAVAVSGSRLRMRPRQVANMPVLLCEDLGELPRLLEGLGRRQVSAEQVRGLLSSLELSGTDHPDSEELAAEGFLTDAADGRPSAGGGPVTATAERQDGSGSPTGSRARGRGRPGSSTAPERGGDGHGEGGSSRARGRDLRRARRFADLEERALKDWRKLHTRRVVASAIAAVVLLAYLPRLPLYCTLNGVVVASIVAALQLARRRRLSGPRDAGPLAAALWVLTLTPVIGVGASLSWLGAVPALDAVEWPFIALLSILIAAAQACAVLAGASAFVYPPAIVIERHDEKGRPTGAFMLAKADPISFPSRDWKPAGPA